MSRSLPEPLLGPDEAAPFQVCWPAVPAFPVLLACDHASSRVPVALANLGVAAADLDRHIAVDIGAAALTRELTALLHVPGILSGYSRLVVDCNRHLDDPSAFPEISDGVVIPANRDLTAAGRGARADALYWPYHAAIAGGLMKLGPVPALIAVHTFTPELNGLARPWQVGILWDEDDRLAAPLLAALRADGRLCVGDNEPYSGRHPAGYTIDAHAESGGLPHVSIEVRQDLLVATDGVRRWAALLSSALRPILASRYSVQARPDQVTSDGSS